MFIRRPAIVRIAAAAKIPPAPLTEPFMSRLLIYSLLHSPPIADEDCWPKLPTTAPRHIGDKPKLAPKPEPVLSLPLPCEESPLAADGDGRGKATACRCCESPIGEDASLSFCAGVGITNGEETRELETTFLTNRTVSLKAPLNLKSANSIRT